MVVKLLETATKPKLFMEIFTIHELTCNSWFCIDCCMFCDNTIGQYMPPYNICCNHYCIRDFQHNQHIRSNLHNRSFVHLYNILFVFSVSSFLSGSLGTRCIHFYYYSLRRHLSKCLLILRTHNSK